VRGRTSARMGRTCGDMASNQASTSGLGYAPCRRHAAATTAGFLSDSCPAPHGRNASCSCSHRSISDSICESESLYPLSYRHDRTICCDLAQLGLRHVGRIPDAAGSCPRSSARQKMAADRVGRGHRRVGAVEMVQRVLLQPRPPQAPLKNLAEVLRPASAPRGWGRTESGRPWSR